MPALLANRDCSNADAARYERHRPEQTLLYQVVEQHYPVFLDLRAQAVGDGRFSAQSFKNLSSLRHYVRAPVLHKAALQQRPCRECVVLEAPVELAPQLLGVDRLANGDDLRARRPSAPLI